MLAYFPPPLGLWEFCALRKLYNSNYEAHKLLTVTKGKAMKFFESNLQGSSCVIEVREMLLKT